LLDRAEAAEKELADLKTHLSSLLNVRRDDWEKIQSEQDAAVKAEGAVGKAREAAVEGIAYHDSNDTRSCDCRYLYAALVKVRRALGGE